MKKKNSLRFPSRNDLHRKFFFILRRTKSGTEGAEAIYRCRRNTWRLDNFQTL